MHITRTLPAPLAAIAVLSFALMVSCGDDKASPRDNTTTTNVALTSTTELPVATTSATTTEPSTTAEILTTTSAEAATTEPTTTTTATTTTGVVTLDQPGIWPAANVVFATPEEAAVDFVGTVFGVDPLLGEFQSGDSMSGEIEVFSPGEASPVSRSLLFLRRIGPSDGWFVIGAANPNATISTPETNAEVAAGALTVEGVARGFEATVVVTAFRAGDSGAVLDQIITSGGALATPEPYSVTIDLTGASPGDIITLLVRGDTGLENDPGDFGALPVVIAG